MFSRGLAHTARSCDRAIARCSHGLNQSRASRNSRVEPGMFFNRTIGTSASASGGDHREVRSHVDATPSKSTSTSATATDLALADTQNIGAVEEQQVNQGTHLQKIAQAPNRTTIWSTHQQSRRDAMVGPRFEQMNVASQPQPAAAIELIHSQPVRWQSETVVSCDGGGGPLGHPRIYINLDKPQITSCTYCGLPFAHKNHRKYLESLPITTHPLD